ncbi:transcriptional repressor [candidate division KSB1 bacterium]|nr:transcriptional repressor [candidate division KSB1 bacterium]
MEAFKRMLVEKGIKPTYQRIKIIEYLYQNRIHPTVEMIFAALYDSVPTLSKTTIYNTLDLFREHHLVNTISITGSEIRYDYDSAAHQHFMCQQCGQIYDLQINCAAQGIQELDGHQVNSVECYLRGTCKNCLTQTKNSN